MYVELSRDIMGFGHEDITTVDTAKNDQMHSYLDQIQKENKKQQKMHSFKYVGSAGFNKLAAEDHFNGTHMS